ncbi:MAG: class I adenylate-forming enzyme family protein [Burkholderiales bacterium]
MNWPLPAPQSIRYESHFGSRVIRCFSQRPISLDQVFRRSAERFPAEDAIVGGNGERITYGALDDRVSRVAAALAARELGAGERIALLVGNDPAFVITLLAAARLNAITVPLNIREQTPELEFTLNQCGAKMIVHEASLTARLPAPDAVPELKLRFAINGDAPGSEAFAALELADANKITPAIVTEEDVAVILYTSGTTGKPKGAMLTHFNLIHTQLHYEICMGLTAGARSLLAVPASHVTGLAAIILTMIHCGGCTVMMREFKAKACLELLARERVSHSIMVPAMYNLCLLQPDFESYDLSAFRCGGYGGAPMPEATIATLAKKLPQLMLINAYGSTETTSPATVMPPGLGATHADSVGQVVPCGDVRVMDDQGREVPRGESGELWIGGPMVAPGYWNNPAATQASFTGGYWRSGDIGSMDAEGFVRIHDRMKDMINRGGYKVYSAEVENVMSHHPLVIESAIVPVPDPVLGEKVQAFVVRRDAKLNVDDLRRFCAAHLSDYKVPDFFTLRDEPLPRNANGKILKRELRDLALTTRK